MIKTERIGYYDFIRTIAILFVIAIHTRPQLSASVLWRGGEIIINEVIHSAVPLFLTLSGYLLASKQRKGCFSTVSFYKKHIPKVYIPCIIWSIPWLLLYLKNGTSLQVAFLLFFGCGYSIYYFIALIIQCYLLFPFLMNITKVGVISTLAVSLLSAEVVSWLVNIQKIQVCSFVILLGPFPLWLGFFTLGIYLAKYKKYLASIKCIVLLILSLFIAVAETLYLHECYGGGLGTKPSSFLVAISIILLLFNEKIKYWYDKHIKYAAVTYISKMSFIIYLTHYYIIIVLSQFCQIDHWIVQWSIVFFTDLLIITIIDRILPQKLKPFVGIY